MSPSPSGRRTIGAVLADLREEFPDVTVSKIRFLESEGLLDPERTPSGYRMYAADDVARLRYILTAQRDRFWPLKVIREALDGLDRGLEPVDVPGTAERPRPPAVREDPDVATVDEFTTISDGPAPRLTAAELAASAGGDVDLITQLAAYGLLRADRKGSLLRRRIWAGSGLRHATCGPSGRQPIARSGSSTTPPSRRSAPRRRRSSAPAWPCTRR